MDPTQYARSVSVVIPSWDGRRTLHRALQSLIGNAAFIREAIVVFSNSASDYKTECAGLPAEYHDHFEVRLLDSGERSNGSIARNLGIAESRGRFIAFLDDDDAWMEDKLRTYFEFVDRRALRGDFVLFSSAIACDEDGNNASLFPVHPYRGEPIADFVLSPDGGAQTSALLMPAGLAKRVEFDPALIRHQDYDFCIRLEAAGARFDAIDRPLSYWYQRGSTLAKGGTFDYCARWLDDNRPRISRTAYVAYIEKELFAAARASGRGGDFVAFVRAQLSWAERLATSRRLLLRAGRKALRVALRTHRPASAELLHG